MIIKPKIRGFICTTSHPLGCAEAVRQQIDYVKAKGQYTGPQRVLIIGASTGYGLASRIATTYGMGAKTVGVFFEKPPTEKKTASAGWYNTAAFEKCAEQDGHPAWSVNGDAFSREIKEKTIHLIQRELGQVDLVIYSLASPKRRDPDTHEVYTSELKTVGEPFTNKTVNTMTDEVSEVTINPATDEEINDTIAVMGGSDWQLWIDALLQANVLAQNVTTLAYSYIGPKLTYPVYRHGTIGRAKEDLEKTAWTLKEKLKALKGNAFVAVNKAVVTQSSSAIPVVPLYISLLFKVMKEKELHEGCIEQLDRLLREKLFGTEAVQTDEKGLIRVDDWEMREDVQKAVESLWREVNTDNLSTLSDIQGYKQAFRRLFGFEFDQVNYEQEVDHVVEIPSLTAVTEQ